MARRGSKSMNEIYLSEMMRTRRTIHVFKATPAPPKEIIFEGLSLALCAPNHKVTNPWNFVWVGEDTRRKLWELQSNLKAKKEELSAVKLKALKDKFFQPPVLIAACLKRTNSYDQEIYREDYASVACGLQNLFLYLHAKGIGSKWSTGEITTHPETYEHLGIAPESNEIVGFLWIGYPEVTPVEPSGKIKLSECFRETN